MRILLLILSIVINIFTFAVQAKKAISGSVYDKKSGEFLIGATVVEKKSGAGTTTNSQGRYTLWIPENCDSTTLEASYLGFETLSFKPDCDKAFINLYLTPSEFGLSEVEVKANIRRATDPVASVFSINKTELETMPALAGEKDLLKYLQLTPGVRNTGDGNSNLYVRGGSADQNLFLLDDMPLYHVNHLGNITSTFNADIIKSSNLYLGAFPAEFGGRLSSVVDVRTIDGNMNEHHQSITFGIITSKIFAEGPIIKNKASYLASFRINTLPLFKSLYQMTTDFSMYDANLKLNYILSPQSRLFFSFYTGDDVMSYDIADIKSQIKADLNTSWGNRAASLRFNHIFSPVFHINMVAGHTKYHYGEKNDIDFYGLDKKITDTFKSNFKTTITDNFINFKSSFIFNNNIRSQAGYNFVYHTFQPGQTEINQSGDNLKPLNLNLGYPELNTLDHAIYGDITIDNIFGFGLYAGIRENFLQTDSAVFNNFQPRFILSRKITEEFATKISYSRIWQPFHLLSNTSAGVPADYRIPAMRIAPPSTSNQATVSLEFAPDYSEYRFTIETYYKEMKNLADLKEGVTYTIDYSDWGKMLATNGKGKAKGIEALLRKEQGNSTGWIGFSIANSKRQFNDLNDSVEYPYKYDRLFDFGCLFQQQISKNLSASAIWVFGTGMPYNIPRSYYEDIKGDHVLVYGSLNQFRQKAYHRLDVGLSYKVYFRKAVGNFDISIINVYNRRNPHLYRTTSSDWGVRLWEFSMFPILPTLSYTVKY